MAGTQCERLVHARYVMVKCFLAACLIKFFKEIAAAKPPEHPPPLPYGNY
uniref:Uncharacterized protein n=1 Tax=Setaria italica TaxID=4555 RepID=K3YNL0_SETIT